MGDAQQIQVCERTKKLWAQIAKKRGAVKKCRNPHLLDTHVKELFELIEKLENTTAQKRNAPVSKMLYIFFGQQMSKAQTAYTQHRLQPGNRTSKEIYFKQLSHITDKIDSELFSLLC